MKIEPKKWDITPHKKAIAHFDELVDAWRKEGEESSAKKQLVEFMETDDYIDIPYQHRNLFFCTASKLRTYQVLPEQAKKQYIECIDLPWLDKDYFRIGRAFDYRITYGDEKYNEKYVAVDRNANVDEKVAALTDKAQKLQDKEKRTELQEKTLQGLLVEIENWKDLKGKSQLTNTQWNLVERMTYEYRMQPTFPQEVNKLNLLWLAFGKIPCKAELDHWDEEKTRIVDIKSCGSITTFHPRNYMLQMSFYYHGINEVLGYRPEAVLCAVDKGTDFSRGCSFGFKEEELRGQQDTINRLINEWTNSVQTGIFPSIGRNTYESLRVYWDSDYYPILENSRPTEILYI